MDKDYDHLFRFRNDIEWKGNIYRRGQRGHSKPSSTINLASDKLCDDLERNFNIVPRKSLILEPPNLENDLALSYIAGYIDGDGCIRVIRDGYLTCTISGTYQVLDWIKFVFDKISHIKTNIVGSGCKSEIKRFRIYGNQAYQVLHHIYQIISVPFLSRKWDILSLSKHKSL